MLGVELSVVKDRVGTDDRPTVNLLDWLTTDQMFGKPCRYAFLIISDSSLNHLSWIESGLPIVRGGSRLADIPALLGKVNLNFFKHIIIHVGVLDMATACATAESNLQQVFELLQYRAKSVW